MHGPRDQATDHTMPPTFTKERMMRSMTLKPCLCRHPFLVSFTDLVTFSVSSRRQVGGVSDGTIYSSTPLCWLSFRKHLNVIGERAYFLPFASSSFQILFVLIILFCVGCFLFLQCSAYAGDSALTVVLRADYKLLRLFICRFLEHVYDLKYNLGLDFPAKSLHLIGEI